MQARPIFIPGVLNVAWLEATTKSQAATNWQPAAVASPYTDAITGRFEFLIKLMILEQF